MINAPVLFARDEYPQFAELIKRKFSEAGDAEEARKLVKAAGAVEKVIYINLLKTFLIQ